MHTNIHGFKQPQCDINNLSMRYVEQVTRLRKWKENVMAQEISRPHKHISGGLISYASASIRRGVKKNNALT